MKPKKYLIGFLLAGILSSMGSTTSAVGGISVIKAPFPVMFNGVTIDWLPKGLLGATNSLPLSGSLKKRRLKNGGRHVRSRAVRCWMYAWLRQQKSRTMPKNLLGQAIAYSLN